ncbi:MAG: GTP-binding protein [Nitrospira sp.]|nr:GTP-binding protein [Nitrospira sp.]
MVPLYVICGPLGAGKTTLLMRLLAFWCGAGKRVGVLMNEAGAISLDGAHADGSAAAVRNITGGCVCCDARDGIGEGLAELVEQQEVDVVVLECSGIAAIEEVIEAVTDSVCLALVRLEKVIAVIEPIVPSDGRPIGSRYTALVQYADEVIVNKQDLYSAVEQERFRTAIVRDRGHARLWQVSQAAVDPKSLLRPYEQRPKRRVGNVAFGSTRAHPMVTTIPLAGPLHRGRFTEWFDHLPVGLDRVKGVCRFSGEQELYEIQYASPVTRWIGVVRFRQEPDPALILIGRNYNHAHCHRTLRTCLLSA